MQGRVLFVATVYTHLAAFHIPFMKLLQSWGYEVHAAASQAQGAVLNRRFAFSLLEVQIANSAPQYKNPELAAPRQTFHHNAKIWHIDDELAQNA